MILEKKTKDTDLSTNAPSTPIKEKNLTPKFLGDLVTNSLSSLDKPENIKLF
jgi:hypothetical protein